ncbi:hydrolase TatD [Labilibaculum manganireducens]|uniref:Hydrolase TatD n=1 Tax=Labilibaculum manganireducens TaxID=1940525 RepID=A0A2N3IA22_9BACT|nr:TatD family hydrolase [Labilibaculum manganireducens]PKQ67171.1 hydrolase TatD [Labilibaculum manganireducens]
MKLIDTHSHIYSDDFKDDIEEIISNCRKVNIGKILLPNIDSESIPKMNRLVKRFPDMCVPMMGLHPTSVKENYREELENCKAWLAKGDYCAIGEIGMDLYWDKAFVKEQQIVFDTQINWALERELPIVIHARDSFDEIFEILESYRNSSLKGVFHSFTGNTEQAVKAIGFGFLLGINGIVTFKNSGLDKTVGSIGLDHLILETDAPYLAPVPKRGKRNESSYLVHIASKLSEIYQLSLDEVAKTTSANAEKLFNIELK